MLARKVLYHLSRASNHFCSGYFGDRVLLFAQSDQDHDPCILSLPLSLGWQADITTPGYFQIRRDFASFFAWKSLGPWSSQSQPPMKLGMTGMPVTTPSYGWNKVLWTFYLGWPAISIPWISVCQIAKIISITHHCLVKFNYLFFFEEKIMYFFWL
jgi:hypothetical protein